MKKKTFFVYSPYKQVISERYEFKSDLGTYTVKLSNYLKHVTKHSICKKILLIFKPIIVIQIFLFVFDTKFYGSNICYIQDYNQFIRKFQIKLQVK